MSQTQDEQWKKAAAVLPYSFHTTMQAVGEPERIAFLQAAAPLMPNPWRNVLIDALVVNFQLTDENKDSPSKALHDLLKWETDIALDPEVSKEARALRDGRPHFEVWLAQWFNAWPADVRRKLSLHDLRRMYEAIGGPVACVIVGGAEEAADDQR